MSRIEACEAIVLRAPGAADDLDASAETLVVRVWDEHGRCGIGECDAPAEVAKAFLEMRRLHSWAEGPFEWVRGMDPSDPRAIWDRLYEGTFWIARRGLGIHALSGLDIAIWDLAARQRGVPVWQMLAPEPARPHLAPYATLWPGPSEGHTLEWLFRETCRLADIARDLGFCAVKMELFYGDLATDAECAEAVRAFRKHIGGETVLALDFGYRWRDWEAARDALLRCASADIAFVEAALQHDDLDGHARLAASVPMRVGGAEAAATRHEAREWIARGQVGVIQCDINRAGGFSEMEAIDAMCSQAGVWLVPHAWKTGITAACGRHMQAAFASIPFFEYLHPAIYPSTLRAALVTEEPTIVDGRMALPDAPGLGITLSEDALARFGPAAEVR